MHESETWKWSRSVVPNSSRPHGQQPTRLLGPWDFPGKSTGVGCHCLLLSEYEAHVFLLSYPTCICMKLLRLATGSLGTAYIIIYFSEYKALCSFSLYFRAKWKFVCSIEYTIFGREVTKLCYFPFCLGCLLAQVLILILLTFSNFLMCGCLFNHVLVAV